MHVQILPHNVELFREGSAYQVLSNGSVTVFFTRIVV